MLGAVDLGERQRQDPRPDRRLDVAHRHAQGTVDADDDIGAALRDTIPAASGTSVRARSFSDGGDAVFEVEDDRIGPAPRRTLDKAALRHRHKQHRAPYG